MMSNVQHGLHFLGPSVAKAVATWSRQPQIVSTVEVERIHVHVDSGVLNISGMPCYSVKNTRAPKNPYNELIWMNPVLISWHEKHHCVVYRLLHCLLWFWNMVSLSILWHIWQEEIKKENETAGIGTIVQSELPPLGWIQLDKSVNESLGFIGVNSGCTVRRNLLIKWQVYRFTWGLICGFSQQLTWLQTDLGIGSRGFRNRTSQGFEDRLASRIHRDFAWAFT